MQKPIGPAGKRVGYNDGMNDAAHNDSLRQSIKDHYEKIARGDTVLQGAAVSGSLGYTAADLAAVPAEADLGLGCGNPQELAKPKAGEHVLDLGSGRGLDCFLASRAVGADGLVYGVDASPTMVAKATELAAKKGFANCRFIEGEIEAIPLPSDSVDLVMSNCVINLSTDKPRVYAEILRVLRPGGRVAISDITTKQDLPEAWLKDPHMTAT